jgi:hypothetical protein
MDQTVLDRHFSEALGADMGRLAPGEIRVVRAARREEAVGGPDNNLLMTPVWVLVARGRGMVSTSRFLQPIVAAWAESFAAPEHLLNPVFQKELMTDIERSVDAPVSIVRHRVLVASEGDRDLPRIVGAVTMKDYYSELRDELTAAAPAVFCGDMDWPEVRKVVASGGCEYGRLVRFLVVR